MGRACQSKCRRKPCCSVNCQCCESWPYKCATKSCWNVRKCECLNRSDCQWDGRCKPLGYPSCSSCPSSYTPPPAATTPPPAATPPPVTPPPAGAGEKPLSGGAAKHAAKTLHKYAVAEQAHQAAKLYAGAVATHVTLTGGGTPGDTKAHRDAIAQVHKAAKKREKYLAAALKAGGCGCS